MRSDIGSCMVHLFVARLRGNLELNSWWGWRTQAFLREIALDIQNLLAREGQLQAVGGPPPPMCASSYPSGSPR